MNKKFILFLLIFINFYGQSQGLFESSLSGTPNGNNSEFDIFSGYVRASAFGLGETYDYSYVFSEVSLSSEYSSRNVILKSDIRFRYGMFFDELQSVLEFKEAYAGYSFGSADILLGNQIVHWGRTDGFNPTNNINPTDYFFLSGDPDDQIMSNFMLRLRYRINNNIDLDFIGIPFFVPSNYRYDLFEIDDFGGFTTFENTIIPERNFKNSAFAGRLNFEYPFAGFAVSYFQAYAPFIGFNYQGIAWSGINPHIVLAGEPYRKQSVGIDMAVPLRSWIFRAEAAYDHTEDYHENIHIPNPDISYVIGIDRRFSDIQMILQYIGVYTLDYKRIESPHMPLSTDPVDWLNYLEEMMLYEMTKFNRKIFLQEKQTNHALMLSLSKPFAYDVLETEISAYYNFTTEEKMIRGKLLWKAADNISLSGGGFYMDGPRNSIFSYSSKILGGVFLEIKAGF